MTDFKIVTVSHLRFLHAATAILPNHCLVILTLSHVSASFCSWYLLSKPIGSQRKHGLLKRQNVETLTDIKMPHLTCPVNSYILKAVRYDRKCFHDSLKRTAVILGNEKLPWENRYHPTSSTSQFRLLPFVYSHFSTVPANKDERALQWHQLETSSVYEIILPLNNSPDQISSEHAKS